MLEEIELYVFDKFIKDLVVEKDGKKKISREELEGLNLSPQEKNFVMYIINKQKIKVVEEKITREDRSPYVKDYNYGNVQANDMQKIDVPVMSKIEYSEVNDKIFEDYKELDEFLETRFIPTYVLLKQRKNEKQEKEDYLSIRLHHILALKLSEAEFEHLMNYLNERNIRVGGKSSALDKQFENYDYITTYKKSALPLKVSSNVTIQKIRNYKQTNDPKIREEIITDNMRLVPYVANRYTRFVNINQEELESYGYEGLILALEKFDVNYGYAFSTYAVAYIRGYILMGIEEILLNKRGHFYYNYINAKYAVENECGMTLEESPDLIEDVIELLVATGKIKDNVASKNYAKAKIISLTVKDASLDDEDTVENLIAEDQLVDTRDYQEEILNSMSKDSLEKAFKALSDREVFVLKMLFGFFDGECHTLEEVSEQIGVTRERIRQIEKKALWKLRHPIRSKTIKDYFDVSTEDAEDKKRL